MNLETGEMAERDIAMTETGRVLGKEERERERGRERERKRHWLASFSKWWIYNINFRDGQVAQANGTLMTENCIEPFSLSSIPLAMRTVTHLKSRFTSPLPLHDADQWPTLEGDTRNRVFDVCGSLGFLRVMRIRFESRLTSHGEVALFPLAVTRKLLILSSLSSHNAVTRGWFCSLYKYVCREMEIGWQSIHRCLTVINCWREGTLELKELLEFKWLF